MEHSGIKVAFAIFYAISVVVGLVAGGISAYPIYAVFFDESRHDLAILPPQINHYHDKNS